MAAGADDPRGAIYDDLHHGQLVNEEAKNRASARLILSLLFECYRPASILDVGCGIGTWLAVAQELGVKEVAGIEGEWLDRKLAKIAPEQIQLRDLEQGFDLGRRFDLVICLEVAEHLSAAAAVGFVASLARHADVVLFSAAVPLQGGHHHVNEQFPDYWASIFDAAGYAVLDILRSQIWYCSDVLPWLRQNVLVFAKHAFTEGNGAFADVPASAMPLALIHPEMYMGRMESVRAALAEHAMLVGHLRSGHNIGAVCNPDGSLTLSIKEQGD